MALHRLDHVRSLGARLVHDRDPGEAKRWKYGVHQLPPPLIRGRLPLAYLQAHVSSYALDLGKELLGLGAGLGARFALVARGRAVVFDLALVIGPHSFGLG